MRQNIAFCFPNLNAAQVEQIVRETYRNFGFYASEFLRNTKLDKAQILEKAEFENEQILLSALATGRPVIVQTAHYGNWEFFSLAMAAKFGEVSIIGRNLDSAVMDEILTQKREMFGIELIPKNRPDSARRVLAAIKSHRLLGVLVDQDARKEEGVVCKFFGHEISHTHAVSVFARKTDALIVPAFATRSGENNTKIVFMPAIDVRELPKERVIELATQAQSDATQRIIERNPSEYFWMHRKFATYHPEIYHK